MTDRPSQRSQRRKGPKRDEESLERSRNECRSISEFGLELVESCRRESASTSASLESSGRYRTRSQPHGPLIRDSDLPLA